MFSRIAEVHTDRTGNSTGFIDNINVNPQDFSHFSADDTIAGIGSATSTPNPNAAAIQADAGHPDQILSHPVVEDLLDFGRPVGVLLLTVLHYVVEDEKAYGAVRTLHDALTPNSYIAISHLSYDNAPPEIVEPLRQISLRSEIPAKARSYAETLQFFDGLELVEPGLVYPPLWRPEGPDDVLLDEPERVLVFGGVGRKL